MKHSELRQDLVSGDWVVIAPRRGARPSDFKIKAKRLRAPRLNCPFEEPGGPEGRGVILRYGSSGRWAAVVIPNKYPAFVHRRVCPLIAPVGIYTATEGVGHHDIVITRDHHANFSDLSTGDAELVFQGFRDRYLMFTEDKCVSYVSIFQNWGPRAGASIYHPHYQIIAIPVVPPEVEHSFIGSRQYYRRHNVCVHCAIIAYELKERKRIVAENKFAVAIAPFASRAAFEMRVFPKAHLPFFEDSVDHHTGGVVAVFQEALLKLKRALNDPDYNFFIHTAPLRSRERYRHYHWHIEVLPKVNIFAGFEFGTGLEINQVDPDKAARLLRAVGI